MHYFSSIRKHRSAIEERHAVTLLLQKERTYLNLAEESRVCVSSRPEGKSFPLHPPVCLFLFHGLTNVSWSVSEPQLSKFHLKDESCVRKLITQLNRIFCFLNSEDLHFLRRDAGRRECRLRGAIQNITFFFFTV